MILKISSEAEKKIVAGILVMNGYTVKMAKVKVDGKNRNVLEVTEEDEGKGINDEREVDRQ